MTDLHCHILPNIDDGAKDVSISLRLLEKEYVGFAGGWPGSAFAPETTGFAVFRVPKANLRFWPGSKTRKRPPGRNQ